MAVVCHQNDLFALAFVRHGHNAVIKLAAHPFIGLAHHLIHGIKRYHFAADFGKSFDSVANIYKADFINFNHVSGMIPAAFQRNENAGIVGHDIALHDIRPLNPELAAFFNTVHMVNFIFQRGQQFAD